MNNGKYLAISAVLSIAFLSVNLISGPTYAETVETKAKTAKASAVSKKSSSLSKSSSKKSKKAGAKAPTRKAALKTAAKVSGTSTKSKLGTDFDFQGLAVGGKYNSADGILTTVEGDKSLDNLLTPRPNFKDRLAEAAESR